jgi:hypothetical protein
MSYKAKLEQYKRSPFPALPGSQQKWTEEELRKLERVLENYHERLDRKYGVFVDTTTQAAAAINTPYAITFNTTEIAYGPSRGTNTSRIIIDQDGIYDFQFSLQLTKASSSTHHIWVWPRINGVDVPRSSTKVGLSGSEAALVAAWNFVLEMKAGDYFQLMWATDATNASILYQGATSFCPAIPSAILTVTEVA